MNKFITFLIKKTYFNILNEFIESNTDIYFSEQNFKSTVILYEYLLIYILFILE